MSAPPLGDGRSAAVIAAGVASIADPDERRAARLAIREEALIFRLAARRAQRIGKFADAIAKFGGGSLLTATVLLLIGGNIGGVAIATAVSTLSLFVVGTMIWYHYERHSADVDLQADRLEAILKETER